MKSNSLSLKKDKNHAICDNINEPEGYYAKQNKQAQKDKYCLVHLYEGPRAVLSTETGSRMIMGEAENGN